MRLVASSVFVWCVLSFGGVVWAQDAPLSWNPGNSAPPPPPEFEYAFVGLTFGIPYSVVGIVPVVGNIVALATDSGQKNRLGWGIAGLAIGAVGLVGSLAFVGDFAVKSPRVGRSPISAVPYFLPPLVIAVTATGLGLASVIKSTSTHSTKDIAAPPQTKLKNLF